MSEPIALLRPQVDGAVVAVLEDLLARARRGEINGLAIATEADARAVATVYAGEFDRFRLIGALRLLEYRILASVEVP